MKKFVWLLVSVVLLVSLCGCSSVITEGEIYKKEYREEHTTIMVMPLVISNGKTTTTSMIPYVVYYPDRYVVFIKAYQDEEWKTEDFYVSKEVYDTVKVGDMFLFDEDRGDLEDEPYTKERERSDE